VNARDLRCSALKIALAAARSLSYLTLWASLYVTGAVACFGDIAGLEKSALWGRTLVFAFLTAAATYLLDRVKLRDGWLDPADQVAHPERYAFLAANSWPTRVLIVLLALGSAVVGYTLTPIGPLLTLAACAGVIAYAGKPRQGRARIKDVFLFKNGFVAAGIAGFAAVIALLAAGGGRSVEAARAIFEHHWAPMSLAVIQLFVRVFADAVVCDLDDEHADRSYRTATLPTHFGRVTAWNIAAGMRLLIGLALILIPIGDPWARQAWGWVTIASTLAMRLWNPRRLRDVVDGRLALEAAVVWAVLRMASHS
jgi:4-hydroxybenzoate polyprenyltransferase